MSTLRTQNICKQFNNRKVVDNVSIDVKSGEVVGLLGPNGAGKTTSFYMTVGLIKPDSGDIFLDDSNITHSPMHDRARQGLGYLPQEASIFRKLSVEDNIRAVLQTRKALSPGQQELVLDELLQEFAMTHLRSQSALALSGGERRRLEIARALATEPRFILLDEPFAGVDPISVIDIQKIIHHLTERDIGVLITDHNVRETLGTCDRAYILNNGTVITEGSAKDILENPEVRDVYLGHEFRM
ncbi:MAG: LPS export ABC transporter ATP-binding protein [Cycloclasticus sp.]|nr:LPS export ABC transporter ATP-binding protein [Cycloclasticus sp.]MBG97024.1 LPS export ABC transporter ATP-binding protein [Cycloclasticus sp.]HAI96975.1 LPS export ABC transporter ATP-binding protein [Methylococcaceae bacterium]|tara:strand:+ start:3947 stop:4672 length:726 start_codon:yes stop_codon:yes gene_type:complete